MEAILPFIVAGDPDGGGARRSREPIGACFKSARRQGRRGGATRSHVVKRNENRFLVGLAASLGAGISMGFAEALSDDGALSGRGHPWMRGGVCGLMTALGGVGHTLPYLIGDFRLATGVAAGVVAVELSFISWIRHHYMDTPFLSAAFQVILGGLLVFLAGILIGSA